MNRRAIIVMALIAFSAAAYSDRISAIEPARLTLEDLASVEALQVPSLSPDGKWFALSWQGQIVLVSSDGGWPTPLTSTPGGKSGLDWSPDGKSIAYASGGAIWSAPVGGGQPVRLTEGARGSGDPRTAADRSPRWSPNGKWIIFETGRRGNGDLAVVSADGLTTNLLTSTPADESSPAWSQDGTKIAYVERSPEYFSGRLRLADFDVNTGRFKDVAKVLHEAAQDRGGGWSIRRVSWSPDGKSLALVLQDTGWDKLYLLSVNGGKPRAITDGESEDDDPVFSPDGRWLAFVSNRTRREERHVWIAPAEGGRARRLTNAHAGVESNPQWSPDGRLIYFNRSSSFEPSALAVAPIGREAGREAESGAEGGQAPRFLIRTQPRNFAATGLRDPEVARYTSKDGLEISGILYKPLGFQAGARYPAVLWIHGGPEGQDTLNFDPWALYLAQQGYLVLEPNYRGSNGYGEKFRNLNVEDSGGGEVDDVVAGAQYLVAQGLADSGRIAIGGGSHGGTMVAYAVTKRPEVFKVAIELYGVVDRATYIERTNRNAAIRWMRKMGGTPQEKPQVYAKANVLTDVPKITAPLLIMHGEDDPQVPPYESQQFVAALKKAGKTHVYFTYPKEQHGFSQREHKLDAWRKQLAFLNRYLQPQYGRSITSTSEIVLDEKDD
jgi:dipeptidyl aminopeptidase/acylaminoacyl peptidase